jgi:hypothetical protein
MALVTGIFGARGFDDLSADVAENPAEGVVRVRCSTGGNVHPRDGLPVDGTRQRIADGPVQEVLERAREASGVFGRGEQERIGLPDRPAQVDHGGRQGIRVQIGIEGGQVGRSLIKSGSSRVGHEEHGATKSGGVGGLLPQAPGNQEHTRSQGHDPCNSAENQRIPVGDTGRTYATGGGDPSALAARLGSHEQTRQEC